MKPRLNLFWRGILLVGIPLLGQFLFAGGLVKFLMQLQYEIDRETSSKQVVQLAEMLDRKVIAATVSQSCDPGFRNSDSLKNIDEAIRGFTALGRVAGNEPEQAEQLKELQKEMDDYNAFCLWMRREASLGGKHVANAQLNADHYRMPILRRLMVTTSHFIDVEEQRRLESVERAKKLRNDVTVYLVVSVPVLILLSLGLGILYSNLIRQPLLRITQNGRLLSQRKPLLPELTATDELGRLDQLFHEVSEAVNVALVKERALLDNAADLICTLDSEDVFVTANPIAGKMLGRKPEQLVGASVMDMIVAEDIAVADEQLRLAHNSADTRTLDLRLQRYDRISIDTRWTVFWSEMQQSLFCVVHDVTEEKNIERAKEDFVHMISHDLRSPLMSMAGSMELVGAGAKGPLTAEAEREVGAAQRNIDRLISFVNDLLDFQKLKAGKMQLHLAASDLESLIDEAVDAVRPLLDAKQLKMDLAEGHWQISCDGRRVLQVLMNLLGNAIKHAPEGSTITIRVTNFVDQIEVRVIDNGPGVPEEYREIIFDAFEQVPAGALARDGSGLGLSICKLIVTAHGGKIGVDNLSNDGNGGAKTGSAFWFRLPLRARAEAAESPSLF